MLLLGCSQAPRVKGFIIPIEEEGGRPGAFTVETEKRPVRILIDEKFDCGFDLRHLDSIAPKHFP